jgi:hypothetical protein
MPQNKRRRSESELPKGAYRQPDGTIVHRGPDTVMKNGRRVYVVSERREHVDTKKLADILIALVQDVNQAKLARPEQDERQAA